MLEYRKAKQSDCIMIASLITDLLGTCDVNDDGAINNNVEEIRNKNLLHTQKYYKNYYVCTNDGKIVGACGLSDKKTKNEYDIDLPQYCEILYLIVDKEYQKQGIGTKLLSLCIKNTNLPILYEAWGDGRYVNSKYLLERCGFVLLKDLGNQYYKNNGYCPLCVNRNKSCNSCLAELYIKQ